MLRRTLTTTYAMAALLLGGTHAQAETIITLEGAGNAQTVAMHRMLAEAFTALPNGITVAYSSSTDEGDVMIQNLLRSNLIGQSLPDAVVFTGPHLRTLKNRGLSVPLSPFIDAESDWDAHYSPSVTGVGTIGDEIYGIGFGLSMPIVAFNAKLVEAAGVDRERLPRDWEGILDLAKRINDPDNRVVGGFMEHDQSVGFTWLTMLQTRGGSVMDPENKAFVFDGPQGLDALESLKSFGESGQAASDMTKRQARQAFAAGTIGVYVTMSSLLPRFEEGAGDRFDVLSVPYPIAEGGNIPVSAPGIAMLTKDPEKQAAVFAFMKFAAGPEGEYITATSTGYAPTNRIAVAQSDKLSAILKQRPNAHSYLENLDKAASWYIVPGKNGYRIADVFMRHLQAVSTLAETPKEALAAMLREVEPMISQ